MFRNYEKEIRISAKTEAAILKERLSMQPTQFKAYLEEMEIYDEYLDEYMDCIGEEDTAVVVNKYIELFLKEYGER